MIVLNGGSSSGKSGIARCLQAFFRDPWLTLGTDTLVEAAPASAAGIEFGSDGQVAFGPEFRALEAAWMTGIAAMAQAGARVIVDEVFLAGAASQRRWQNALGPLPVLWVGVRCDPAVAAAREIARGDRIIGMAASQADLVHVGMIYDLEVDTGRLEAFECARIIAAHVEGSSVGGAERGSAWGVEGQADQAKPRGSAQNTEEVSVQGAQRRSGLDAAFPSPGAEGRPCG